jgi:hypothetical protein
MLGTEFVEFGRQMASMAIENEEPISTNSPVSSLGLEDLSQPFEGKLIGRPAVIANSNTPRLWQYRAVVP